MEVEKLGPEGIAGEGGKKGRGKEETEGVKTYSWLVSRTLDQRTLASRGWRIRGVGSESYGKHNKEDMKKLHGARGGFNCLHAKVRGESSVIDRQNGELLR